jgi:hypothetical protein
MLIVAYKSKKKKKKIHDVEVISVSARAVIARAGSSDRGGRTLQTSSSLPP